MSTEIYYKTFGPVVNYYGYKIYLAIIDDLFVTKVFTPYNKKQIRFFFCEKEMADYIDLVNADRRF
jgi:hypothetical protein